jgi:osmotically-inducible protein OsmY
MADNNRNRQDSYRQQYDWNEDYNRQSRTEDEPNYSTSENRGHRDSGRYSGMSSGDSGWQSRYERQMNTNREGDFDSGYGRKQYGRQDSDYNYGTGQRGISSGYSDFGGDYSRSGSRNLYDRGYQGMGRRDYQNEENRLGGANYDRYGDQGRYGQGQSFGGGHGGYSSGNYSGSNYGRSDYGSGRSEYGSGRSDSNWGRSSYGNRDYDRGDYRGRDYGRGDSEERSWWDRTTDEVSSWFGDEEAQRRRERDRVQSYRGKGPKNYSRSDDRIKEDINDRLSDDPFVDASDIDVTVTNGEVTLTGSVDHRSTKRRAEDLAEAVSGVKNVENRLRVMQNTGSQYSGSQGSGLSSINNPAGSSMGSQSSSPVAGSDRGRKETSSLTSK